MRLQYAPEDEAFRAELVAWLDAHQPVATSSSASRSCRARTCPSGRATWQRDAVRRRLARARLAARARRAQRDADAADDLFRGDRRAARSCAARTRRASASSPRRSTTTARPSRRSASSLPDAAGRDLVVPRHERAGRGQRPREPARRAPSSIGDEFVVNGQKVWTSGAHHADWCLCFVRTDPDVPKHKGISALIIDTTTPGVERRPFPELSDPDFCDFNEVFFTDVRVPKENLVGPLNGGWPITQGSLAHERAMLWIDYAYDVQRAVRGARRARRPSRCPAAAGSATTRASATRSPASTSTRRRCSRWATAASRSSCTGKSSPEHSLLKLFGSESLQRALLFGARGARRRRARPRPARPADVARGLVGDPVPALVRRHDPRRHERDPAQHHRRARARPAARVADGCGRYIAAVHVARVSTQNSLPSGSASTTHAVVALADVDRVARRGRRAARPRRRGRRGSRSMCSRFLTVFASGTGTNTSPGNVLSSLVITTSSVGLVEDLPVEHARPRSARARRGVVRVDARHGPQPARPCAR